MTRFCGAPILVEFRPCLRAVGGRLLCGGERGTEVHAGSFLKERRIVLDSSLRQNKAERDRILAHEIFHFVWWKLGRTRRAGYETWVAREIGDGIPGEMGWSAEWRKADLRLNDRIERSRRWFEYLSESFCDSAAVFILQLKRHDEITLPPRARQRRSKYLEELLEWDRLNI